MLNRVGEQEQKDGDCWSNRSLELLSCRRRDVDDANVHAVAERRIRRQ